MIHNKRDEGNWTDDVEDWEKEFDDGDIVIGDGYGSFRTMIVVHEIQLDELDHVVHRGVFWRDGDARDFAELIHED